MADRDPPAATRLQVEHVTRYHYGAPVDTAQHEAFLRPVEDEFQKVEAFEMGVDPEPLHHSTGRDRYGNHRTFFTVSGAHRCLEVWARSRVKALPRDHGRRAPASLPWEAVRARLRYAARAAYEPASEFAVASPYVPRLAELAAFAAPSLAPGQPVGVCAIDLMHRVHAGFVYESASTTIDTPLATVLAERRGVCQDFAHLMIGALRMHGLAARYVSGYLLTTPPDADAEAEAGEAPARPAVQGVPRFIGADASHAWVAVWCPTADDGFWLELDPTNDMLPATDHVRLAYGRDFGDVTPLRGVIRGGGDHALEVGVTTERLA
ncbi:transglutaminase family protein [Aquincola sp. MAHUQ-54]|uniref:Transglutaminase family protein n=1 Tax=Aquincola agrisoli TaxID=3119538 RepID=A0AAW9QJ30_9BURK